MTEHEIDDAEDAHRNRIIEAVTERGIYRRDTSPLFGGERLSSCQAVIREFGETFRRNHNRSDAKSRSHELHKSQLRLDRRASRR